MFADKRVYVLPTDQRGSVVITVLMVFLMVTTILGAATVMVPALWRHTTGFGEQMLATQVAESGLEHAKAWVSEHSLQDFVTYPYGSAEQAHSIPYGGSFYVVLEKDVLTSTGRFGRAMRQVRCAVKTDSLLTSAVYAATDADTGVVLSVGSKIIGDVLINASHAHAVNLGPQAVITGDLLVGPGGDPYEVIDTKDKDGNITSVKGKVGNIEAIQRFELPEYPSFPTSLPDRGAFDGRARIDASGHYSKMEVKDPLVFDLTQGDLHIHTSSLNVGADITLEGSHRLWLYVDDQFNMTGNSSANKDGDPNAIIMYYSGTEGLEPSGNTQFVGCVYAKTADVKLSGNVGIIGSVVTGGKSVTLDGCTSAVVRVIYAPHARVEVTGNSHLQGAVVAKTIEMGGNTQIEYASHDEFEELFPGMHGTGIVSFSNWRAL